MKLINRIKKFFKKSSKFNYIEYSNQIEIKLNSYFNENIDYSNDVFNEFWSYVFHKCRWNHIYPTANEIRRYLKREITFDQIRDRWEEFEQSNKTEEDHNRIIKNGLILTDENNVS